LGEYLAGELVHAGRSGGADWFRQLDLAPFDGLNWPHLEACDLSFRVGLGGRSP
jgi:hypothetical protein